MADDLPVELKVRTLSLKPNTDEDEKHCVRLKKLLYALVLLPPSKKDSTRRER